MQIMLSLLTAITLATSSSVLQIGGGGATYGNQRGQSGYEKARTNELAKRSMWKNEDGRYLDAAVLMNVPADEYLAVFAVAVEAPTLEAAHAQMEGVLNSFDRGLRAVRVGAPDAFVDYVTQARIYAFEGVGTDIVREVLTGFELKKNVAVRYRDKAMLERILKAATESKIFDLVKVDYIVKDHQAVQSRLMEEAAKIIKRKAEEVERLLGLRAGPFTTAYPAQFSIYYPSEMYDHYTAQEAENVFSYRQNQVLQRARKPQTFYYRGLDGKDFDHVVNPSPVEPMVQFTVYLRVKY